MLGLMYGLPPCKGSNGKGGPIVLSQSVDGSSLMASGTLGASCMLMPIPPAIRQCLSCLRERPPREDMLQNSTVPENRNACPLGLAFVPLLRLSLLALLLPDGIQMHASIGEGV